MDFVKQLQSPTLSFLLGGMVLAALGSQLQIPESICKIIIFMLLAKIGLTGGMAIRNSNLTEMVLPVAFSILLGILIVFIARYTLAKLPKVKTVDAIATGGLFGAVSGSTMAAALALLDEQKVAYEAWAGALYPFMDIPALVTAIVIANIYLNKKKLAATAESSLEESLSKQSVVAGEYSDPQNYPSTRQQYLRLKQRLENARVKIWLIVQESLQGPALSAMLLGIALGLFARPESVYENFYRKIAVKPLALVMGI